MSQLFKFTHSYELQLATWELLGGRELDAHTAMLLTNSLQTLKDSGDLETFSITLYTIEIMYATTSRLTPREIVDGISKSIKEVLS